MVIALRSLSFSLEALVALFGGKSELAVEGSNIQEREPSRFNGESLENSFEFMVTNNDNEDVYKLTVFTRSKKIQRADRSGQARLNFSLRPVHVKSPEMMALFKKFEQKISHKGKTSKYRDISVRFDLDTSKTGHQRGFSMDTGRSPHSSSSGLYEREGDILGKLLSLASQHASHNYDSFDSEFSDPVTFGIIVRGVSDFLTKKFRAKPLS